ncbi:zinc finger BED domain-containing protein RICESLEEPER 2-like [Papaver somniferum]|uniref:zinc finger BED domain-containing protein RICESLEEPER 2-like n=1 Tax=Papaver somniferum TaxID=3469 RepID=UPI000E6FB315|nr:zinc finger BED domain-containing protein RICESLEEPER 2-like [Papaver somniferum]
MHYIYDEWKLIKKTLAYILVSSLHTGEVLASVVKSVALDWNIDNKLFAVVADNASSNNVMMANLKSWLDSKDCLVLNGDLFRMRCSDHVLDFIVLCGMKVVAPFIEAIRECVKYVKSSQARKERFKCTIAQVKLPASRCIGLDVDTRWNSTFKMLKDAIFLRQSFVRIAHLDNDFKILPTSQ